MITAIEIENFKAFGERQRIELRPITLLFGPNSGGKSSVIHAIHLAREIFVHRTVNVHCPESGGGLLDLGGIHSFIHGRRLGKEPLRLKFDLDLNGSDLPEYPIPGFLEMYVVGQDSDVYDRISSASVELEIRPSSEPFICRYSVAINGVALATITASPEVPYATLRDINWAHPIFSTPPEPPSKFAQTHLADLAQMKSAVLKLMEEVKAKRKAMREDQSGSTLSPDGTPTTKDDIRRQLRRLSTSIKKIERLERDFLEAAQPSPNDNPGLLATMYTKAGGEALPDTVFQIHKPQDSLPSWGELLGAFSPGMAHDQTNSESDLAAWYEFQVVLTRLITGPGQIIRDILEGFRYIGPLRTLPPRGWRPPAISAAAGWANGITAWQLLRDSASAPLLEAVNRWFLTKERLDTEYSVERTPYQELPVEWTRVLTRGIREGEISVDGQGPLEDIDDVPVKQRIDLYYRDRRLELQDVGVGISQVLPVVVAALDPSAPLVAFEQPELHLHPKQQAALGDLFIEALQPMAGPTATDEPNRKALSPTRVFIIETHSEALILRMMRRIRETSASVAPPNRALSRDQLAILHVHHEEGASRVVHMRVDEDGDLLQPWPDSFFDQDAMERFA